MRALRYIFLILLSLNQIFKVYGYQNPYQTLRVGPFHSLSYIYQVYLDLVETIKKTNSKEIIDKLEIIKRAYLEIKLSRFKEKEEGPDELFTGILTVAKQCTMAIIIFYFSLVILHHILKFVFWLFKECYLFFIMNIVIFQLLQNFFMPLINNVKVQYMLTLVLSVSVLLFRYYSRKQKEKSLSGSTYSYGVFQDEPSTIKVMEEKCVEKAQIKNETK
jgi:hypothetical protein